MKYFSFAVFVLFLFVDTLQAAPALDAYSRLPETGAVALSPSGKRYAFVASDGVMRKLCAAENGKLMSCYDFGRVSPGSFGWIGEDHLIVRMPAVLDQPLDFVQAYEMSTYISIDLRKKVAVSTLEKTKKIANVVMGDAGTALLDGQPYSFFSGMALEKDRAAQLTGDGNSGYVFNRDRRNLYRVNIDTGDVSLVARGGEGPRYQWAVDGDGKVLAYSIHNYSRGTGSGEWRLYRGESSGDPLLERSTKSGRGHIWLLGPGRTPNTVIISDDTSGISLVEEVSLAEGRRETLLADMWPLAILSDPVTRLAIGAKIPDEPGAKFFDDRLQARFMGARKAFPGLLVELESFSRNLDRLVVRTSGGDDSGTFWLVDIGSGAADPIGRRYPGVGPKDVGPLRRVSYKAGDGLEIGGVLTLPPGLKPEKLPLIVLPLEVPIGDYSDNSFDWRAQAFASQGYAVLRPDHRGSGGRDRSFLEAGFGQFGLKIQSDLSDGISALAAQGVVDAGRVCIVGYGDAGYMALAGVTLQRNIYRCAVSVDGYADLPKFYTSLIDRHGQDSVAARFWIALAGAEQDRNRILQERSPTYFAAQATAPVLLIHTRENLEVPFAQSEQMAAALRKADKPVELLALDGDDYRLARSDTRKTVLQASVDFVRKYNPPN